MAPHAPRVHGDPIDERTRCRHHHGPRDIVALRIACCERLYPCVDCHEDHEDHPARPWPRDQLDRPDLVLCGACHQLLSATTYMASDHACPRCDAAFNPACRHHWDRYFDRSA